jgi:integrase/recombinase XerD
VSKHPQKQKTLINDSFTRVFVRFCGPDGTDKILFKEIDVDFLKKFEKYLRDQLGNRMNTIHANLKMMRKLFNDAVREELIPYNLNPFPRYPLRTEKSDKIYLTESEIEKIENLDLTQHRRLNDHRNLFLFACTAAGVRISDLFKLKWKNFNGTHILFTQQKTREQNGIKLPLKALAILEGYKSQTGEFSENYIFPFLTNQTEALDIFDSVSSMTAYANKNLKEIARMAGIEKHITTHTARHTFATRALRKGIRIENVSKLLGHSSIKTTQVYAKIVNEELDKSMEVFNE